MLPLCSICWASHKSPASFKGILPFNGWNCIVRGTGGFGDIIWAIFRRHNLPQSSRHCQHASRGYVLTIKETQCSAYFSYKMNFSCLNQAIAWCQSIDNIMELFLQTEIFYVVCWKKTHILLIPYANVFLERLLLMKESNLNCCLKRELFFLLKMVCSGNAFRHCIHLQKKKKKERNAFSSRIKEAKLFSCKDAWYSRDLAILTRKSIYRSISFSKVDSRIWDYTLLRNTEHKEISRRKVSINLHVSLSHSPLSETEISATILRPGKVY